MPKHEYVAAFALADRTDLVGIDRVAFPNVAGVLQSCHIDGMRRYVEERSDWIRQLSVSHAFGD